MRPGRAPAVLCNLLKRPYTLARTGQPMAPQLIPTYSIDLHDVPDLFLQLQSLSSAQNNPRPCIRIGCTDGTFPGSRERRKTS